MSTRTGRENNFNIIRFVAALMVMAGHMAYICGSSLPLLFGEGMHAIGVKILFLVGGFLISKSWLSDPSPIRYAIKRVMRIFPALIFYCILVVFVFGPLLSTLSIREYFFKPESMMYLKNIFLYPVYGLPGVFEHNPYPNAVNGSLWTLPVEIILYIILPIIVMLLGARKKSNKSLVIISIFTSFICLCQIIRVKYFPTIRFVIYGTDLVTSFDLIPWYFLGLIYTYPCVQKRLNLQVSFILVLLISCLPGDASITYAIKYIALPYIVFSFALIERPFFATAFRQCEISYGIYLYSFFVQQSVVYLFQQAHIALGYIWYLAISFIITYICALFSFKVVEMPTQNLCTRIIIKLKDI